MKKTVKLILNAFTIGIVSCMTLINGFAAQLKTEDDTMQLKNASFNGITINGENTGVLLSKASGPNVTFSYLGVDNTSYYTIDNPINNGIMEITITNNDPNFSYVDMGSNYKNVIEIGIPDQQYASFNILLNKAPIKMPDFNAPVVINSNRGKISIVDTSISSGTYNITNSQGGIEIVANDITKNMVINNTSGDVTLILGQEPENLHLDTTNCSGYLSLPSGWTTLYTVGNGIPSISISNNGLTDISIN